MNWIKSVRKLAHKTLTLNIEDGDESKITNKFELDPEMDSHIESYSKEFNKKLDRVISSDD